MENRRLPRIALVTALTVCVALLLVFLTWFFHQPGPSSQSGRSSMNLSAHASGSPAPQETRIGIANPAAVYCLDLGYQYRIADTAQGERGECVLPDYACDDWDFLSGKCGAEYSYCARLGYQVQVLSDGKNPFSPEYAVCVSADGRSAVAVSKLIGLEEKIYNKKCDQAAPPADVPLATTPEPSIGVLATTPEPMTASHPGADAGPNALPTAFDWRSYQGGNWLSPVRNQGQCGSCWAFAAVGAAEAAHNVAAGNPDLDLDLSEQYLVSDCLSFSNCCGGYTGSALNFIRANGIPDEGCMPYVDGSGCACPGNCSASCTYNTGGECSDRRCTERCPDWASRLKYLDNAGYAGSARALIQQALVDKGPLTASMRISCPDCGFDGDIYRCGTDVGTNHAVVLVGYNDAGGYWIVRNSWGAGWGPEHSGYFKLGYNECSIESYVNYVEVSSGNPSTPTPTATLNPGTACSPVKTLSCGSTENGSNAGPGSTRKINTYSCTTWLESGPEMVYEFKPNVSGVASLELRGMSADLDLFVLRGQCTSGNCLAFGDQSTIFPIAAGQTYFVVVDGYKGAESNYTLSANCLQLPHSVYIPISAR